MLLARWDAETGDRRQETGKKLQHAADGAANGVGGDSIGGVGDPFADAFLGGLLSGRSGEAEFWQQRLVGDAVEGDAEGRTAPGGEGGLDFDQSAVGGAGECSEDPVNALQGEFALVGGKTAASDIFGENDGRRRLAFDARRQDLFGNHFGAGAGEAADESSEEAFGDAALAVGGARRAHRQSG